MQSISSRQQVSSRPSRATRTNATVDRRAAIIGGVAAVFMAAQPAFALKIASQESTGGMLTGGGSMPKSSTLASMEGYTLEGYPGTKKPSFLSAGEKKELRARARELASLSK